MSRVLQTLASPRAGGGPGHVSTSGRQLAAIQLVERRLVLQHGEGGAAVALLEAQEERARVLDVTRQAALGGGPEGHGGRMVGAADERQGVRQAAHGGGVYGGLVHA